jgi:hypothetical protein
MKTVTTNEEIDCRTVDQKAAELIVRRDSQIAGATLLDKAIAKCPPDVRRHHQRAMVAAALSDTAAEAINMDRAITLAEQSGDRCLVDLMILEKKALQERRSISELPDSCKERPALKK